MYNNKIFTLIKTYSEPECGKYEGIINLNQNACCTPNCGICGGSDCSKNPGGSDNCCVGNIKEICGPNQNAPCLLGNLIL